MSQDLVREVAGRVLTSLTAGARALVAVDGVGGSGKSTFATRLAECLRPREVVLLHVDDFFLPSAVRHARGRYAPEGFWLDSYNYDALVSWALVPLGAQGIGRYRPASFDHATDMVVQPALMTAPRASVTVVEGTFLHRDELAGLWDFSIYLDTPFEEATRRMAQRRGTEPGSMRPLLERYVGAQQLYFRSASPWQRASLVVDNSNAVHPRLVDAAWVDARVEAEAGRSALPGESETP